MRSCSIIVLFVVKRTIVLLLFAIECLSVCKAQQSIVPVGDSVGKLDALVITATRKSSGSVTIPYSVSIVTSKDLEQFQYRTSPEALVGLSGVFVQKTNHGGGSPIVRGLTGNQNLILVDGVRFNNATFRYGPNQYFNTIDPYSLAAIEVVRGTGSVQYGSDALGGVIQVFTKNPQFSAKRKLHLAATTKAMTAAMEYTGRAELKYQSEKVALLAGVTSRDFGDVVGGGTSARQYPSGYKEHAFDLKILLKPTKLSTITLSNQFLKQSDVPLFHKVQLEKYSFYYFDPQQRNMSYAKFEKNRKRNLTKKITVIGSLVNTLEKRNYQKNINGNHFSEEDKVYSTGLTADIRSLISRKWTANCGVEFYHDKVNSFKMESNNRTNITIFQRGLYPNAASSSSFSLYGLHHININCFQIEAGIRYNRIGINIPDQDTSSIKLGDVRVNANSLVSNAGLLYKIRGKHFLYSSFSTGFRVPNIDDLGTLGLVDFRYEIPAYDLRPEKTYNSELGYRYSGKKLLLSVSVFHMKLSNLITRVQVAGQQVAGYNVYTKENSQDAFVRGADLFLNVGFSNCVSLKSNVSYTFGQNTSRNEPMRRIPPLNGCTKLEFKKNGWQAVVENLYAARQVRLAQGDIDDNRIAKGGTPSWNIINVYGGFVRRYYSIRMGWQNLFNKDYRTHGSGINSVGRSAWMSCQINL